jgi:predicted transposase YbfD/YdcC
MAITSSISRHFGDLPDPRSAHGLRYPLTSLITIAVCGVICGAEDWVGVAEFGWAKERWFRTFLELPDEMPSDDTFRRVLERLDPDAFERCFQSWSRALAGMLSGVVSLDGKTLRRSFDAASDKAAIHMISAWAVEHGLVFGQLAVDDRSNEITAIPKLLEMLDLKGVTVTIDAMGCQKDIAQIITTKGGEYVLAVKDNQPTLHENISRVFDDAAKHGWRDAAHDTHTEVDKGHGRIESRTTTITWSPRDLIEASGWSGVTCLVRVQRTRTIGEATTSTTTHHFIASVPTRRADRIAEAVRSHWSIENQLHWRLDVTFNEDQSRLRKGHGAQNMSRLRRVGLNLLKRDTTKKMGIKNKRLAAAWNHDYLVHLLAPPNG